MPKGLSGFFINLNTECMNFLECDLEKIIMNSSNEDLQERGLPIYGVKKNQVTIGNYGRLDLVTYSWEPITDLVDSRHVLCDYIKTITIYELKKDKVSLSAFAQSIGYLKGIQQYFKKTGRDITGYNWEIVLIGKEFDKSSNFIYLTDMIQSYEPIGFSLNYYSYEYTLFGLNFHKEEGYQLTNEGF
jgi:hypothetical protein